MPYWKGPTQATEKIFWQWLSCCKHLFWYKLISYLYKLFAYNIFGTAKWIFWYYNSFKVIISRYTIFFMYVAYKWDYNMGMFNLWTILFVLILSNQQANRTKTIPEYVNYCKTQFKLFNSKAPYYTHFIFKCPVCVWWWITL